MCGAICRRSHQVAQEVLTKKAVATASGCHRDAAEQGRPTSTRHPISAECRMSEGSGDPPKAGRLPRAGTWRFPVVPWVTEGGPARSVELAGPLPAKGTKGAHPVTVRSLRRGSTADPARPLWVVSRSNHSRTPKIRIWRRWSSLCVNRRSPRGHSKMPQLDRCSDCAARSLPVPAGVGKVGVRCSCPRIVPRGPRQNVRQWQVPVLPAASPRTF